MQTLTRTLFPAPSSPQLYPGPQPWLQMPDSFPQPFEGDWNYPVRKYCSRLGWTRGSEARSPQARPK